MIRLIVTVKVNSSNVSDSQEKLVRMQKNGADYRSSLLPKNKTKKTRASTSFVEFEKTNQLFLHILAILHHSLR